WQYDRSLFDRTTIERLTSNFEVLLEEVMRSPEQSLSSLPLLRKVERHQLVLEWNEPASVNEICGCVNELFNRQALQTSDRIAAIYEDRQLSYQELNRRANQLGHYLQRQGAGPEVRVGICLERGLEMIVGVLGVLEAGSSYLPLDLAYPSERLSL